MPSNRQAPPWSFAAVLVTTSLMAVAPPAGAAVITFDDEPHGRIVSNQYQASAGVRIEAINWRGGPHAALVFDTRSTGTADPDLEAPWDTGNLFAADVGGALIIAENAVDANGDGLIDSPDDQAVPIGSGASGELWFKFDHTQTSFGFDILDCEGGPEATNSVGFISFRQRGVEKARVYFSDFTSVASPFYDPTIVYGDNSANRIQPISAERLGITGFNSVSIILASGAVDNVTFSDSTPIPEPAGVGLLTLLAAALALRRRRRRASGPRTRQTL